ncbi:RNA dependent RNA polymerase-domain-containing protein [Mycena polygramma]|nr:RNA dependent RNA polymerase-domain-containing protein [Mycena polygramma]
MEYNFNDLLDEMVPRDMGRPVRKQREPPAFKIQPHVFSMGSTEGPLFKEKFRIEVDYAIVTLNLEQQKLFFRIPFANAPYECPTLNADCPTDDLQSVRLTKQDNVATLTVILRRPPRIEADFRRMPNEVEGLATRRATELDWSPDGVDEGFSGAPGSLPRGVRVRTPMKFGLWLTYRFEFFYRPTELERVTVSLSRLRALERPGVEKIAVTLDAEPKPLKPIIRHQGPYYGVDTDQVEALLAKDKYPFDARYLIVGLVSQGLVLPHEVAHIIHILWPVPAAGRVIVLRALFRLERSALVGSGVDVQIDTLTRHLAVPRRQPKLPADRVSMRRAVVTPTRVLLFPEVIETGNRVLRAWPAEMRAGRFIRVGFADEDGRLRITRKIAEAEAIDPDRGLLARILNVLHNGVWIADRHYVFLAAGESQLKDHSCWMVCEDGDFTAERVRQQMGDFSKEQVVAKYAARMGLCFSATRHVVDLVKEDIEPLDDIKHGEVPLQYTYTDGVGNCSQELATMCARALGSDQKAPSAIQIRMGGVKGVLSVHPHLEHNQVCIRPSMNKFESPLMGLGVMKVSRFAPAHLNRQAICIMEALGMNVHALLQAFTRQIQHAENLELELRTLDASRHPARHVYKNTFVPVTKMIKAGLGEQLLLKNVLKCIKCQLLRDLKYKARVLVPDGAYLMGIADEYEVLEEGQIYCAITPTGPNSRQVITGQCTIFRSPCIHPGDARVVTAVDHPVFQELPLTNVVVFSTKKAPRDLPSMLGGGDLDGDFYTVIYDKELQITKQHQPMDYTAVPPRRKEKVEIADICDFVADFIKSDVLGIVASNFQALADQLGPTHPDCIELAKLNSDAVDFAKSGVAVHIPGQLVASLPNLYPSALIQKLQPTPRVVSRLYG